MSGAEWVVGFHAVLAVLEREGARVEVVWLADGLSGGRRERIAEAARRAGTRLRLVPRRQLDEVATGVAHNGFGARVAPVPLADADELLGVTGPCCLVGLDGVEDGHNLGAIIRSVAAFGLEAVVVAGPHPPPLGGAVAKVAAGTLPLVRVAHVGSLGDFAVRAKERGFWVMGAEAGGTPLAEVELPDRLLLCLGAEAGGLRAKTLKLVDETVAITHVAAVESLNLSVAAGILCWEWRRRYPIPQEHVSHRP